jgi:2-polyprenyl-3-methyl-5-hydroxy-6-metoxy-1,4-benzoquinol methylase
MMCGETALQTKDSAVETHAHAKGCNLCGGTERSLLQQVGATQVVECRCGLVYVTPTPPRAVIEQLYQEEYYEAWKGQARARQRIWQRRWDGVKRLTSGPGRLLDVGCGDATFLRLAKAGGWDVVGTEFSARAVAAAADCDVRQGEVWEARLPADSCDVVTSWHVIEHVSDPRRMVMELFRVLRPGGRLVLATPNLHDYLFRAAYVLGRFRLPAWYEEDERELHLFNFSASTLTRLVQSVGFVDVTVGFDRGAAAVPSKQVVNAVAYGWYRLTGLNWGIGMELAARKPAVVNGLRHEVSA